MLPLLLGLLIAPCSAQQTAVTTTAQASAWAYAESVAFKEIHDPSTVWLEDNRRLEVICIGISRESLSKWTSGKRLQLAYSTKTGVVLVDPISNIHLPVIGGLSEGHPLDRMLDQLIGHDGSTVGLCVAFDRITVLWEKEIERLYGIIAADAKVSPEVRQSLAASRRAWLNFRAAHLAAASELFSLPAGSIWRVNAASHRCGLTRDYALRLNDELAVLQALNTDD